VLALDSILAFDPEHDGEFFSGVPPRPGVLAIGLHPSGTPIPPEPYLVRTADLRRTAERLLQPPQSGSKRLNLRTVAMECRFRVTGSRLEQALTHYQHARAIFPRRYRDMLRLRAPAMLKVNLQNSYPRCYVTRKIFVNGGFYLGPFASRKSAEEMGSRILDLFKVRRCQIRILRDPQFPGCIYSEMKMCLAPCFAGCTAEAYDEETARLVESLATRGSSLLQTLEAERDAASEALEFERAAAVQKRLEKVHEAFRGFPDVARRVEELNAVIFQRGAVENSIVVFPIRAGVFADVFFLDFSELSDKAHSAEETLRAALEITPVESSGETAPPAEFAVARAVAPPVENPEAVVPDHAQADYRKRFALRRPHPDLGENLALLARWYYSNPREGEILFREGDWPYRRILRACARLLRPHGKNASAGGSAPGAGLPV
jgi:excinuclease ABC subunit C